MVLTGYLEDLSVPELFQFLEQGKKTGLLAIRHQYRATPDSEPREYSHYIWLKRGRFVGAANRLDNRGLTSLIALRGWLETPFEGTVEQGCPSNMPLGIHLKSQGLLQSEQLKVLFEAQVLRRAHKLFKVESGWFQFDAGAALPSAELTGLSMSIVQVTLVGLRALRNWQHLADKLPPLTSAIAGITAGKPDARLDTSEWQLWEYANGSTSLAQIALQLQLHPEHVRQIAFRLLVAGLVDEVPCDSLIGKPAPEPVVAIPFGDRVATGSPSDVVPEKVSTSFLQSLVGFLRDRV